MDPRCADVLRTIRHATPVYREEDDSAFTHDGEMYNLNCALVEADRHPIERVAVADLRWIMEHPDGCEPPDDDERIARADLTTPLLLVRWEGLLATVDGAHRLARALREHVTELPCRTLTSAELSFCVAGR
jgi:hypothetical protein